MAEEEQINAAGTATTADVTKTGEEAKNRLTVDDDDGKSLEPTSPRSTSGLW